MNEEVPVVWEDEDVAIVEPEDGVFITVRKSDGNILGPPRYTLEEAKKYAKTGETPDDGDLVDELDLPDIA